MRLLRAALFTFGRPAHGVAQWGPLVLTGVSFVLAAAGLTVAKPGGYWLPTALALALICIVLGIAVVRLHRIAFPDVPNHRFEHGPLWILKADSGKKWDDRIVFSVDYTNRESKSRVHLTVDVWWIHESKVQGPRKLRKYKLSPLGPYRFWPRQEGLGNNRVFGRPEDIGPERRAEGLVAVECGSVPGLEVADESGGEVRVHPNLRLYARLMDDISGAEWEMPLSVKTTADQE